MTDFDIGDFHEAKRVNDFFTKSRERDRTSFNANAGGQSPHSSPIDLNSRGNPGIVQQTHDPNVDGNAYLVEHVVNVAATDVEVANGGATVIFGSVLGDPEEQVGWSTVVTPTSVLTSDLTGTLDLFIEWKWQGGRTEGGTVTIGVGDGNVGRTPPVPLSGGPIDLQGCQIVSGEAVTVTFPNATGSTQYLDYVRLRAEVRETAKTLPNSSGWLGIVDQSPTTSTSQDDLAQITTAGAYTELGAMPEYPGFPSSTLTGTDATWDGSALWLTSGDFLFRMSPDRTILEQIDVGFSAWAVAWDGTNLWVHDNTDDRIVKMDTDGNELAAFAWSGSGSGLQSLEWDGTNLYGVTIADHAAPTLSENFYKIDPSDGTVLATVRLVGQIFDPGGITFDGANWWWHEYPYPYMYRFDPDDGSILETLTISPWPTSRMDAVAWVGEL